MAVQHVRKVPFQSVSKLDREAQRQLSRNFDTLVAQLVPTGTVVPWAGRDGIDPPQGWALCDGTHPGPGNGNLFRVIGTTFGGTGINDFLTPNMSDRFPRGTHLGSEVGDTGGSADGVASHSHSHSHSVTVNGNNFNTGFVSADHAHTGGNHNHGGGTGIHAHTLGGMVSTNTGSGHLHDNTANQYSSRPTGAIFFSSDPPETNSVGIGNSFEAPNTGGIHTNHTHNANHGHSASSGTDATSAGAGGGNLPPYTDFRFIIKT